MSRSCLYLLQPSATSGHYFNFLQQMKEIRERLYPPSVEHGPLEIGPCLGGRTERYIRIDVDDKFESNWGFPPSDENLLKIVAGYCHLNQLKDFFGVTIWEK